MTVRLRPHHLLCVLTYVGKGYTEAFNANLDAITARLARGEGAEIVAGPDDVCAPLLDRDDVHCRTDRVRRRDADAASELAAVLDVPITTGSTLRLDNVLLTSLRAAFAAKRTRTACIGCEWSRLCSDVASDGFSNAKLMKPH